MSNWFIYPKTKKQIQQLAEEHKSTKERRDVKTIALSEWDNDFFKKEDIEGIRMEISRKYSDDHDVIKSKILDLAMKVPKSSSELIQLFILCFDELSSVEHNKLRQWLMQYVGITEFAEQLELLNTKQYGGKMAEDRIRQVVLTYRSEILEVINFTIKVLVEKEAELGGLNFEIG